MMATVERGGLAVKWRSKKKALRNGRLSPKEIYIEEKF
jgi:hypothetical protein